MNLARGQRWVNVWPPDENSRPERHPVTDIEPSWVILSWERPWPLCAVRLSGNVTEAQVFSLREEARGNPAVLPRQAWRRVRATQTGDWWSFEAVETRAVKVLITGVAKGDRWPHQNGQVAEVTELRAMTDLGAAAVPALPPTIAPEPPFTIACALDREGEFCLAVDDDAGHRVANLLAQVERGPGVTAEPWNLKDLDGQFVAPGTYRWKGIIGPRPDVRYEMTVYPNVSTNAPQNSPWLNGHSGSGGWLADHSGNSCVTTFGDSVFIGAYCAESGVALIETDLDGAKTWGRHNLAAWAGPQLLANDGANLYAALPGENEDRIWRIDAERRTHEYLTLTASRHRHNGIRGIAVADGKLYLGVVSPGRSWLNNAFTAADVDIERVRPLPPREAKGGRAEDLPDPRHEFLRMLRVVADPPGHPHANGIVYLTSESGPERRQHVLIPFHEPVPVGSVVFAPAPGDSGYAIRFSLAKPGAPYPPNPDDESQWQVFGGGGAGAAAPAYGPWNVVAAPENAVTRALRISFVKGGEDELLDALDQAGGPRDEGLPGNGADVDLAGLTGGGGKAWAGRLEGVKILRRRFASLFPTATVRVNSGVVNADGVWDAQRTDPLSPERPGVYVLEWEKPQPVRGLAIKEIDGEETRIDIYTGPETGPVAIAGEDGWKEVATYHQGRRYYYHPDGSRNPLARYLDGYVDFGDVPPTRAVRLRVIRQWLDNSGRPHGIREDLGGRDLDPKRCRVWGVAPLAALGGEAPVDPRTTDRLEVRDLKSGRLERELAVSLPGALHISPRGRLLALAGGRLVEISPEDGGVREVVGDLLSPSAFAVDAEENLYVYDAAPERGVVRVYEAGGKYVRDIGTPGGWSAGAWDPTRLHSVVDMAVDRRGQLWLVESATDPKRVTVWSRDGKLVRELLGNTGYGGGGILDRYDKTRLRYGRMEFALDWESGGSRLAALNFTGVPATGGHGIADLFPVRRDGHRYLASGVSHPSMAGGVGFVFLEEGETARLVAALGGGDGFEPLSRPEFRPLLRGGVPAEFEFVYADRNGDGTAQPDEVELTPIGARDAWERLRVYGFDSDLGVCTSRVSRFEVKEVLPNGTPILAERPLDGLRRLRQQMGFAGYSYIRRLRGGDYFVKLGSERTQLYNAVVAEDGALRWRYPVQYEGVQSLRIYPWRPGWVVHQFVLIGDATVPAAGLGEILAVNANCGQWNLWTADGLLFSQVFLHQQNPAARLLNFPEHERGMLFENLTMGQEHFSGSFTQTEADGKTYVVCGHNHITVAEVAGWERFRRVGGEITVTPEDIARARAWDVARAAREVFVRAPQVTAWRGGLKGVAADSVAALETDGAPGPVTFNLLWDEENLYVHYRVIGHGPLANTGNDPRMLFKSGAAADLRLGLDPDADPARDKAGRGDLRLVMTLVNGKPVTVLYDAVNPGAPAEGRWELHTPGGGRTAFDRAVELPQVRLHHTVERSSPDDAEIGYTLSAAIPFDAIGWKPEPGQRLKLDWGILVSDTGNDVRTRRYWADVGNTGTSDAPSEARLHPNLWGYVEFAGGEKGRGGPEIDPGALDDHDGGDAGVGDIIEELEDL
ncbi:MAG: hypothetical protein BWZ02_02809 [Lentisphaerae bacterium ADurb.BinA184]|nr:MAG: hypothetical protein BWZ02_02809 [Lentisphaerae bacterium ADurb.BinA184]